MLRKYEWRLQAASSPRAASTMEGLDLEMTTAEMEAAEAEVMAGFMAEAEEDARREEQEAVEAEAAAAEAAEAARKAQEAGLVEEES